MEDGAIWPRTFEEALIWVEVVFRLLVVPWLESMELFVDTKVVDVAIWEFWESFSYLKLEVFPKFTSGGIVNIGTKRPNKTERNIGHQSFVRVG